MVNKKESLLSPFYHFRAMLRLVGITFVLVGCSQDQRVPSDMEDCYNHYKAESYLVALEACEFAAAAGEAHAQWLLGQMFRFGLLQKEGEKPEKAFDWYLMAAKQGHVAAMREVGIAYLYENGVSLSYKDAHIWLLKSANQNDTVATFTMGYMFFEGKGREKDLGAAISWFKRSAASQHAMSINNLAWIYATSDEPAYSSIKKAKFWLNKMESKLFEVPMFIDTKAAVMAAQEKFELAVTLQNEAIAKLPDDISESELLEYQQHLESYLIQQPWKESL
ncbi:MAG: sel1 repeat family protein [Kangiellaceae bacterium]|nr:sel1 repeat family protein [Kangiellaceae bacterium]